MKKPETIEEMEKRDAAAYARMPQLASEIEEWEPEQLWDEDEEGDPEVAIHSSKDGTTAIALNLCARIVNDDEALSIAQSMIFG